MSGRPQGAAGSPAPSPRHTGLLHPHPVGGGGGSSARLSVGSLALWAWPGDAPRRRGLQKGVEGLLSSITREGGERFGKMLGGKLALETTGPGDCQPRGTHLSSRWGKEGHSQPPTKRSRRPPLPPTHPPRDPCPCPAGEAEPSTPCPLPSPASAPEAPLSLASPSPLLFPGMLPQHQAFKSFTKG